MTLNQILDGHSVRVMEIRGGKSVNDRLRALGIRPGATLTKVSGLTRFGPTVVQCGQTQTALGNGVSSKVIVEEN
jgi:ferrous iron transport protein A